MRNFKINLSREFQQHEEIFQSHSSPPRIFEIFMIAKDFF